MCVRELACKHQGSYLYTGSKAPAMVLHPKGLAQVTREPELAARLRTQYQLPL